MARGGRGARREGEDRAKGRKSDGWRAGRGTRCEGERRAMGT